MSESLVELFEGSVIPCPWCGARGEAYQCTDAGPHPGWWKIGCASGNIDNEEEYPRGCSMEPETAWCQTMKEAVEKWEDRAPDAAGATGGALAIDWTDPGHRLTEMEIDAAEKTYNDARRGRNGDATSCRTALEAVIRGFLASNRPEQEVYCHPCSVAGGANLGIHHLPPACGPLCSNCKDRGEVNKPGFDCVFMPCPVCKPKPEQEDGAA